MANVPNAVEMLPKLSTASVGCTSVTDRQMTGRRTGDSKVDFSYGINKFIIIIHFCIVYYSVLYA